MDSRHVPRPRVNLWQLAADGMLTEDEVDEAGRVMTPRRRTVRQMEARLADLDNLEFEQVATPDSDCREMVVALLQEILQAVHRIDRRLAALEALSTEDPSGSRQ